MVGFRLIISQLSIPTHYGMAKVWSANRATMNMWFLQAYYFHMFSCFLLLSVKGINTNTIKYSTKFKINRHTLSILANNVLNQDFACRTVTFNR